VGKGYVVVLAFNYLLGEISPGGGVPVADIFGGFVECKSQIPGPSLLHMNVAVVELAGLVGRG